MKKKTDRVLHSLRNQQTHHENSKLYPKQMKPNRKKNTLYGREYEMGMQEVKVNIIPCRRGDRKNTGRCVCEGRVRALWSVAEAAGLVIRVFIFSMLCGTEEGKPIDLPSPNFFF
jgi:hypothetical protein